jgi:hypothetical protein
MGQGFLLLLLSKTTLFMSFWSKLYEYVLVSSAYWCYISELFIIKDDKHMASKYQKKKQEAAQVEASDKEQTESSSSGHQVWHPYPFS